MSRLCGFLRRSLRGHLPALAVGADVGSVYLCTCVAADLPVSISEQGLPLGRLMEFSSILIFAVVLWALSLPDWFQPALIDLDVIGALPAFGCERCGLYSAWF